ncbi:MAG: DUF2628 domain-containing protein [Alphaproteobacteria bacterium]|nr:DUF2628 domain-containing protein [Alphaproteobacteria bacterium]
MIASVASVKPKWRPRFEFFEAFGAPDSVEARAALKAMADSGKRSLITSNWAGYLLGPIYFLTLGMWRRALTLSGIVFLAGVLPLVTDVVFFNAPVDLVHRGMMLVSLLFGKLSYPCVFLVWWLDPDVLDFGSTVLFLVVVVGIGSSTAAETANYSYYLTRVRGDNGWNPYKGLSGSWWRWLIMVIVLIGILILQRMIALAVRAPIYLTVGEFWALILACLAAPPAAVWYLWKRGRDFPDLSELKDG